MKTKINRAQGSRRTYSRNSTKGCHASK